MPASLMPPKTGERLSAAGVGRQAIVQASDEQGRPTRQAFSRVLESLCKDAEELFPLTFDNQTP
ncbi:hypothetical protein GCM10007385_07220 [Tateyamaria omphalii]|nr:hypothetical protein GCM10007385_07220 [Tateyamaria omphalii]